LPKLERLKATSRAAKHLFQSYPRTDYDDPDGALASFITVLSGYSVAIMREATSVETGIQRVSKFPPRISELVEFCDKLVARLANYERLKNWGEETLRERQQLALEDRSHRLTLEQLKAKHGGSLLPEGFGKDPEKSKEWAPAPKWKEIVEHYQQHPERMQRLLGELGTRNADPPPTTEEPQHDLSIDPVPDGPEREGSETGRAAAQAGGGAPQGRPRGPKAALEEAQRQRP
jgi:hypothetical protein